MKQFKLNAKLSHISADSRKIKAGGLFLAYPGEILDGRKFIQAAINQGASAVLWDSNEFGWNEDWQVEHIAIEDLRQQAGVIASQFYGRPSHKLWMIGVTGTNGKTSVTHWLVQCFAYLNRKAALIGTLGNGYLGQLNSTKNTTPDSVELQKYLADYLRQETEIVAMEVSSHGLVQGRLNGTQFDIAILTNITQDHLDYHGDMQSYSRAKQQLFDWPNLKLAIINTDDHYGKEFYRLHKVQGKNAISYGVKSGEVRANQINYVADGFSFEAETLQGKAWVQTNLMGEFNVYNVLAVLAALLASKVSLSDAVDAIQQIKSVSGRMQLLGGGQQPSVVIDYAHTPDALESVLNTLKLQSAQRLICVFGCGGDRDVTKRPEMGRIATQHADMVIVTSDNPRYEDPANIIQDIVSGVQGNYLVEQDRAKAIRLAIEAAKAGDIVLIAGKGHEETQEIAGVSHPFSDAQQVNLVLGNYEEAFA